MSIPMSKLQKAIGAVKDQTSISLAKVKVKAGSGGSCRLAILKATSHDEVPMREQEVGTILQLAASSRAHACACAGALGQRITRTHSWAVALKSLLLLLRLLQDGDLHFPKEILSVMRQRPSAALSFSASSWHFTAFVRTFSLYLDERLHCFLTGKMVRRRSSNFAAAGDMMVKPPVLLERLSHWQRLLDRAMGTRPTGPARSSPLVRACLYAVVQESFDLYRDVSDSLALLLDSFFHLQPPYCTRAYHACLKASRQFSDLSAFYDFCKAAGVGGDRTSDYPSVTGMSQDLLDTLHDFLKHKQLQPAAASHGRATSLEDLIGHVFVDNTDHDEKPLPDIPAPRDDDEDEEDDITSIFGWEVALMEDATQQLTISDADQYSLFNNTTIIDDGDPSYNPFLCSPGDHVPVQAPPNAFASTLIHPTNNGNGSSSCINVDSQTITNTTG